MSGFFHRMAVLDMTKKTTEFRELNKSDASATLGGKGFALDMLLKENPKGVNPLAPENRLIISIGPITGTNIWGGCRHGVFTKSPLTGFFSESYSGGTVAEYIAKAGIDAVMIHGASDAPVWLEINDEEIIIHDASNLWGLSTYETEDKVKKWIKDNRIGAKKCGVITIGPAGENLVAFAVIENDYWRSAGRTGVGAVMGSKKVKAIAFWGNQKKELAHPDLAKDFAKKMAARSKEDAGVINYKTKGTPMLVDIMNNAGGFPTRFWKKGVSDHRDNINATALHTRCDVKPNACLKCFMACGRLSVVKEGRHKGLTIEGPEYETIYAFGGLCEVSSIEEIAYLNDVCDRLGMDTITAGNLAAMTIEASIQGLIDYQITYGDVDKIVSLLEDISAKRGIGATLALGIKHASKMFGMEDQAIHVKGMEPAGYDPRVLKGMGLAYGSSPRGACHLRATFYKPELAKMIDPDQISGKADMFTMWEDRLTLFDTLVLCRFYRDLYQWEELSDMLYAVTGLKLDNEGLRKIAQHVTDNARIFNIREGLTPEDDRLPSRFHKEALPESGKIITREDMDVLLSEYYKARGWDENGIPMRKV